VHELCLLDRKSKRGLVVKGYFTSERGLPDIRKRDTPKFRLQGWRWSRVDGQAARTAELLYYRQLYITHYAVSMNGKPQRKSR
jgi:hypothetical protein